MEDRSRVQTIFATFALVFLVLQTLYYVYWYNSINAIQPLQISTPKILVMTRLWLTTKLKNTCPVIDINNLSEYRYQLYPTCDTSKCSLKTETVSTNGSGMSLPRFQFNDTVLYRTITTLCNDGLPVPNIVHFVYFGASRLNFYNFLAIISAYRIQKPCLILYHADRLPYGNYWDFILQVVPNIIHVYHDAPETIHNRTIKHVEHKADWIRLQAIKRFGGIYADADEVFLRSVDTFRKYNMTLGYETGTMAISNALIIGSPDSEFLGLWIDSYKTYNPDQWGEHSVLMPVKLNKKYPGLLNVQSIDTFMKPSGPCGSCLDMFKKNLKWDRNYCMHLYSRYDRQEFTVKNIRELDSTFGAIARYILYNRTSLC